MVQKSGYAVEVGSSRYVHGTLYIPGGETRISEATPHLQHSLRFSSNPFGNVQPGDFMN